MRTLWRSVTPRLLLLLLFLLPGCLLGIWSLNVTLPVWLIQALPVLVLSCALGLVTIHIVFGNGTAGLEDAGELAAPRASSLSLSAATARSDSYQRPGQHRRHRSSPRYNVPFAQEQLEHPDLQHQPQHQVLQGQQQQQQQQQRQQQQQEQEQRQQQEQQRLEQRSPWEDLPDALFAEIVARLGPEDLRNLRCACREWFITTNHTLTRLAPSEMRLDVVVLTFPYLTSLDLGACAQDIRTHRLHALRGIPRLEHLSLGSRQRGSATAVNDRCLLEVARSLRALKSLNLSHCVHLSDEGFIPIGQLSCLTRISLASSVAIGDLGVVLLAQLPALAELEMPMCFKVTNKGLAALGTLHKTLTSLDISGCQLVTQAGVSSLSKLTSLEKLSLLNLGSGQPCVNDESLRSLSTLTGLTSLALGRLQDGVGRVSEAGLASLADHHPHLAHLSLLNKDELTDAALEALALGLQTSLRTLHIRGCSRITQASVAALANLTGLTELDLVNNMAMSTPANHLRQLIGGCSTSARQPQQQQQQHSQPGSALQHSPTQPPQPQQILHAQQQQQQQHVQSQESQPHSNPPQMQQAQQQQHAPPQEMQPQHIHQEQSHHQQQQQQQQQQHALSQQSQPQHAHLSSSATSPDQPESRTFTPAHADTHSNSPLAPASLSRPPLALRALSLGSVVGLSPLAQPCNEVLATLTPLGPTLQSLVLVSYTGSLSSRPAADVLAALSRLTLLELQGATGLGNAGLAALTKAPCTSHLRSLSLIRAGSSSSSSSSRNTGGAAAGALGQAAAGSAAAAAAATASAPQMGGELGSAEGGLLGESRGGGAGGSCSWDGALGVSAPERGITELGMLKLVGALGPSSLTSLNLSHCPAMGDGLLAAVAARLQGLTSLSLVQASGATDAGVSALSALTRLRTLDLSYCEQVTGSGFGAWVSRAPPPPASSPLLSIHSHRHAAAPAAAPAPASTVATPLPDTPAAGPSSSSSAGSLIQAAATAVGQSGSSSNSRHAAVQPPQQQQQQQQLLPGHDSAVVVLPLRQRLLSLHLSCCSALNDSGLAQVGQHLTSLTCLDLSQCPCITDFGTKHLTRLTRLSGLDLAHCSRLANYTLAVASRLPLLTSLKLPGCVRISDAGLAHLPALRSVLLTLHLDKCIKVSDAGLAKVAQLTSLTSLRLARCPDITDEGVAALAHCTRLSALSLAHCSGVSEASLFALSGLTGLASLEF